METKEHIKLDETLKMLFNVSKPLVISLINYFFNENFDESTDYKIEFGSTDKVSSDLLMIRADFFVKIDDRPNFHIEFQLSDDKGMILRMVEYGFRDAMQNHSYEAELKVIRFPKQVVFYLEENEGIPDELKLKIVFPNTDNGEQSVIYKVGVKKAWMITQEDKINNRLYSLLPLEIFKLRAEIKQTKTSCELEYKRLAESIRNKTKVIVDIAKNLMCENKITNEDYCKITDSTIYLFNYFSKNYGDMKLSEEVDELSQYVYTRGYEEGIEKGIQNGIMYNVPYNVDTLRRGYP